MAIFGFIFELIISTAFGALVLMIHPKWKLNVFNLIAFNFGSFVSIISVSFLMNLLINNSKTLNSTVEVITYLTFLVIALISGGCLGIIIGKKTQNFYTQKKGR